MTRIRLASPPPGRRWSSSRQQASLAGRRPAPRPGFTITLKKGTTKVTRLKAGTYSITVADKSSAHNFHLIGAGVNKKTTVAFIGKKTWTVTLQKGKTYRFVRPACHLRHEGKLQDVLVRRGSSCRVGSRVSGPGGAGLAAQTG